MGQIFKACHCSCFLYGAQVTTGYLMMLIAMTYSADIFAIVAFGLKLLVMYYSILIFCSEENDLEIENLKKEMTRININNFFVILLRNVFLKRFGDLIFETRVA